MIVHIRGQLKARTDGAVVVEVSGLSYLVHLPIVVEKALEGHPTGEPLELETIQFLQVEQSKATPMLIGFATELQKEFFEKLLTVPKMGPKGAMQAMARSVSTIATAIERADYTLLQSLPGVGRQKSRDLVATLQGKIAKFALLQDADLDQRIKRPAPPPDVLEDALQLLIMLGHRRAEAERLVREAITIQPDAPDAEALVRVIYRKQQEQKKEG